MNRVFSGIRRLVEPILLLAGNRDRIQISSGPVRPAFERLDDAGVFPGENNISPSASCSFAAWASTISSSLVTLRELSGATEREFLQIGSEMQNIYLRSSALSQTAQTLVEVASGERAQALIEQLRQMLQEMETYLEHTQIQNSNYCTTFNTVEGQLEQIVGPLEGFNKMSKNLYILEVLIKTESAHIGEIGGEFINLALDINKLTKQIKEKSTIINEHKVLLSSLIAKNMLWAQSALSTQEQQVLSTLGNTVTSITELEATNQQFFRLGSTISSTSTENANHISQVVQSMQFHDIFRQQVEHVAEALEGLLPSIEAVSLETAPHDEVSRQEVISRAGDVCELQEAQLQFASAELYAAVTSIVSNLSDIVGQQKLMAQNIYANSGMSNASGRSFIDDVAYHMSSITELLTDCGGTNNDLAVIMKEVTDTVGKITCFVSDIEGIGQDINLIALNARIKAASTGPEGASLCVLAEEIGHLSHGDAQRTDTITATLNQIHDTTGTLFAEAKSGEANLAAKLIEMKATLHEILDILETMGSELVSLLSQVQHQVHSLSEEIETLNHGINVHERAKVMADTVLAHLQQIFVESRNVLPASAAFKEDLRRMAERYTMESERRIHEDIASRHGVQTAAAPVLAAAKSTSNDSEFGDNVDLF